MQKANRTLLRKSNLLPQVGISIQKFLSRLLLGEGDETLDKHQPLHDYDTMIDPRKFVNDP